MLCRTLLSATVTTFALAAPIKACKLALVLAVDVSGSVSPDEYNIQMRGLAEALRDGAVSEALVVAKAAVSLIQWTGKSRQKVTIPWVRITNFEDTDGLADLIATQPRSWQYFSTAIGEALVLAEASFFDVPDCARCLAVARGVRDHGEWFGDRSQRRRVGGLFPRGGYHGGRGFCRRGGRFSGLSKTYPSKAFARDHQASCQFALICDHSFPASDHKNPILCLNDPIRRGFLTLLLVTS
jgi:hypothetical protein